MLTLEIGIEIEELEQRIAPDGGETVLPLRPHSVIWAVSD